MFKGLVIAIVLIMALLSFAACAGTAAPDPTPAPAPTQTTPSIPAPSPAAFQIDDLTINPVEINPGEEAIIMVRVSNTGGTDGLYTARLGVNSIAEEAKKVVIPAGKNQTITFPVVKNIPGTYEVTCGNLSGQFVVVEPVAPASAPTPPRSSSRSCCN